MSLWQKTLFYLGLVDEDDTGVGQTGAEMAVQQQARPRSQPQVDVEPPKYERRLQQQQQPVARTGESELASQRVSGRRVEPPLAARRRLSQDPAYAEAGMVIGSGTSVRTVSDADLECEIVTARSYSDAQLLADHIRANQPVVLDLRKVEPAMVRRLVDFASGLTYALGGSMRKVGQGVILVTPANVNITRDERRRLASLGYYEAPEGS